MSRITQPAPARVLRDGAHESRRSGFARLALFAAPVLALLLAACAAVQEHGGSAAAERVLDAASPYFDARTLDLSRLLPPPPADDSLITRGEIELMLRIQQERTPEEKARAQADASYSVFRFADALGSPAVFNAKSLPKTSSLFRKVTYEEGAVIQAGKRGFMRPRPFLLEPRIEPVVRKPTNASYPSGHAMWSRVVGLLLADMLPEYSDRIMARADDYAFHRVVAGVHYPSDVDAGKHAGTALAAFLLASPAFQPDYAAAKQELRKALGLAPQT
jgi:acid phosphatase (class A)